MSANDDLDRRLADHYAAEAPARAPDWVLDGIAAAVDSTPQRRTVRGWPWRIPTMPSSFAKLSLTATTLAVIGVVAIGLLRQPAIAPGQSGSPASPVPSASPLQSRPPKLSTFTSTIHGISFVYPSGWEIRRATESASEPWMDGVLPFDSPAVDVIFDPAFEDGLYLVVASQPYGEVKRAWVNGVDGWLCPNPLGGEPAGRTEPAGGVDGHQVMARGCGWTQVATIDTETRGYLVGLVATSEPARAIATYDYWWLRALLDTVELRPEDALDAP